MKKLSDLRRLVIRIATEQLVKAPKSERSDFGHLLHGKRPSLASSLP